MTEERYQAPVGAQKTQTAQLPKSRKMAYLERIEARRLLADHERPNAC